MLIYSLYKAKLSKKDVKLIITTLVLIISLIIIISNFCGFSYGNYSSMKIEANFFKWFDSDSNYSYLDLASKGLFEYGNQIGAVLIMCLPFAIYWVFKKFNFLNCFTLICNIFALILLCTRVAVLGVIIVFVYTIFAILFVAFIQKQKFKIKPYIPICSILVVYVALLPINPMFNRLEERATVIDTFDEADIIIPEKPVSDDSEDPDALTSEYMKKYIEANFRTKNIHPQFIYENYPYEHDPEFWYNLMQNDMTLLTDYRFIETSMVKRVVEINNNPMDKLFGITHTRVQNIFNIEKDFVVHYYSLGIIGTFIVLAPYFILIGIFAINVLKSKFKDLTVTNGISGITLVFALGIAYMSGNLLNSLSFTLYFALLFYLLGDKVEDNIDK